MSLFRLLVMLNILVVVNAQYMQGTEKFAEEMAQQKELLTEELIDDEYTAAVLDPPLPFSTYNTYSYENPPPSDYAIGILMDPCKSNEYDCCMRRFGSPEYPMLLDPDDSDYRLVPKYLHAPPDYILSKTLIVDEDGVAISSESSRFADDHISIDESCMKDGDPVAACVGAREMETRSTFIPACMDNNDTVSGILPCTNGTGYVHDSCVAVAVSQTALNVVCSGDFAYDPHCGTFIEVHMAAPNDYAAVEDVLGETRISEVNITGYITTHVPTTWKGDPKKVLCSYQLEDHNFVGTMVLVAANAPRCCVPQLLSLQTNLGSFMCPSLDDTRGPFAPSPTSISELLSFEASVSSYPYCPAMDGTYDSIHFSLNSTIWPERLYSREADILTNTTAGVYGSKDLAGTYPAICPYFNTAGLLDDSTKGCNAGDSLFTFAGRIGKVVSVPVDLDRGLFGVSFNDGRTSYLFENQHISLELDYNYELWWVQRTKSQLIVRKRRPFTVTDPACTFDIVNGHYFPYAMLDEKGEPIE